MVRSLPIRFISAFLLSLMVLSVSGHIAVAFPGQIRRVNTNSLGTQSNNYSFVKDISFDGSKILFVSPASDLVDDDTNNKHDLFIKNISNGVIERVNVSSSGGQGDGSTEQATMSPDGRYVVFNSSSTNLVPDDTNGKIDVFLRDTVANSTELISVNNSGVSASNHSQGGSVSDDGRYVVFQSASSELVSGDTNNEQDVFIRDRIIGVTTRLNISSSGSQAIASSFNPEISCDGRFVLFASYANNLVDNDTNAAYFADIFFLDRQTSNLKNITIGSNGGSNAGSGTGAMSCSGNEVVFYSGASNLVPGDNNAAYDVFTYKKQDDSIQRVSRNDNGNESNGESSGSSISSDGRFVAFSSKASNLMPSDTNGKEDIYVKDLFTGDTTLQSINSSGDQGNGSSYNTAYLSGDGKFVTFVSDSTNLVDGDTNNSSDVFLRELDQADTLPPSVVGLPDRSPNQFGWYNEDVLIDWIPSDPEPSSGIPSDPGVTLASTEGQNVPYISGQSCDPANNCSIGTISISLDKTAPSIVAAVSPEPNSEGWNKTDVGVEFNCNDTLSGIHSCSPDVMLSGEGEGQNVLGTASDFADNSFSSSLYVNIDKTSPTIGSTQLSRNFMLFFRPITIVASSNDSLSGISASYGGEFYVDDDPGLGNGNKMTYSSGNLNGSLSLSPGPGFHTVHVRAKDKAGNWSNTSTASFWLLLF